MFEIGIAMLFLAFIVGMLAMSTKVLDWCIEKEFPGWLDKHNKLMMDIERDKLGVPKWGIS